MSESIKWLSMDEIAKHIGFSRDTILKMIKEDGMPASKVGGQWRFDVKKVDQWMADNSYPNGSN